MVNFEPLKGGENWPLFSAKITECPVIELKVSPYLSISSPCSSFRFISCQNSPRSKPFTNIFARLLITGDHFIIFLWILYGYCIGCLKMIPPFDWKWEQNHKNSLHSEPTAKSISLLLRCTHVSYKSHQPNIRDSRLQSQNLKFIQDQML